MTESNPHSEIVYQPIPLPTSLGKGSGRVSKRGGYEGVRLINNPHSSADFEPRIVGFICNWSAYSGVEMAGVNKEEYPPNIRLVKLTCLGRLHSGLILRAFELGADGVILLGCPQADCHYEFGIAKAKEMFTQTKRILNLLGIDGRRLVLVEIPLGCGDRFAHTVVNFVQSIKKLGLSPLASGQQAPTELVRG